MASRNELLAQARALDDAAGLAGRDERASALRQQAADLRVQALGPRPYPIFVCHECFHLTGWVGADGTCATDIRRRVEKADANHLGMLDWRVTRTVERKPLLRRLKSELGVATSRDRIREWLTKVDPNETGPIEPEEGWAIEWPVRAEEQAPEGPHLLVVFDVRSYRFEYGSWRECDTTPAGKPRQLVPREFSAALPVEALAQAWYDFEMEVAEHNARVWEAEQERRERSAHDDREREAAYESEHGTSELLG